MAASELTPKDFDTLLKFTTDLARSAGELIRRGSTAILQEGNVDEKKNSVDLVTEWDVKVEDLVRSEIARNYPDFKL
jgi:myo-inositol-1(or 4)-monophosphatase